MNEYCYDNIKIGLVESFTVQITEDMMQKFRDISGDENPMHIDEKYAQAHGCRYRLVYGMLTSSFYSKFAGEFLPGKFCVLKSVESFFDRPVYVGDVLTVSGRVKDKDERFQQVLVKVKITNQDGKTVSRANILAGFYE